MAVGGEHLRWKAEHLSSIHTLQNTRQLIQETLAILQEKSDSPWRQ